MNALTINYKPVGYNGTVQVTATLGSDIIAHDTVDLAKEGKRDGFAARLCERYDAIDRAALDRELLRIATELAKPAPPATELQEIEFSRIVRPELFHTTDVSGIAVAVPSRSGGKVQSRWHLYLRWSDGRRERREIDSSVELPSGTRLYVHPIPGEPSPSMTAGWSAESRRLWLAGSDAPNAADAFKRLCSAIARHIELSPESAAGTTATLALWIILTYVYPVWGAVPYLSVGGPLGSGKSTLFTVLARLIFRAIQSSNMTSACLFRTLHEHGGTLLLDEAERLRDGSPDAGELRSILLSGYKVGSPARRLEKVGDGFQQVAFDVYGPKAIASIAKPPEALASRCIPLTMFRAGPESEKPRRRIDADPAVWRDLRDDLHALALEHGPTWPTLAGRADVVPTDLAGREFELWQPILALAAWVEESGARGLLGLLQEHARSVAGEGRDDATPEADEALLRIVAGAVVEGRQATLKAGDVLAAARQVDASTFDRWTARGVSAALARYGVKTSKGTGSTGRNFRRVTVEALRRIERAYSLDLGLPPADVPHVPHAPQRAADPRF